MFTLSQLFLAFGVLAMTMLGVAFVGYKPPVDVRLAKKEKNEKLLVAEKEAQELLIQAKNRTNDVKKRAHEENEHFRQQLERMETLMNTKDGFFKKRELRCQELHTLLGNEQQLIAQLKAVYSNQKNKADDKLVELSGMQKNEVKELLIETYRQDILAEKEKRIAKVEEATKDTAKRRAKEILLEAIQKYSAPTSVEQKTSTVTVPRDEVKGYLLGKDGSLIQYFEEISEVDVIFNDLPKTIHVSAYNLIKRHIATSALEKLVRKRSIITQESMKKALEDSEKETDENILETGRQVAKTLKLKDTPQDLLRIIGRLNFRTSYGQNILKHSFEVAALATTLAHELGADVETCRLAAFFHDIGKAIDYEVEGAHDDLSKQILEKYGFSPEVVYAAYAHHDKVPANTIPSMIVKAADAISAGRPGARQESMQKYLERLGALEETAMSFTGVQKTFAISAGREIRVIVDPEEIQDEGVQQLAKNIAHKIETDLTYPGKIKVNVIRKTRSIDYAK